MQLKLCFKLGKNATAFGTSCMNGASVFVWHKRGARGVMVIVVGNGHGDTSSSPGRHWFHFT